MVSVQPGRPVPVEAGEVADPLAGLRLLRENRGEEDRLVDLLAFALATEDAQTVTPANLPQLRQRAEAELSSHALLYLHNRVEEIRTQAVLERLGQLRRPPGMVKLVVANLLALVLVAAAAWWLASLGGGMSGLAEVIDSSTARLARLTQDAIAGLAGLIPG